MHTQLPRRSTIHLRPQRERELGFARELIADKALTLHLGDAKALVQLGEHNLHDERIARNHGAAELHAVNTGEKEFFLRAALTCVRNDDECEW